VRRNEQNERSDIMNPLQNSSVGTLTVILAVVTLALSGCATVGPSSVQLAAETSARSAELGTLHQELVHKYFALERERIETFLTNEWEPTFLRHLLGTSGILQDLQESQAFDDADRAELSLALKDYLTDPTEADKLARAITTSLTKTRAPEPAVVRTILAQYVDDDRVDAATAHVSALLGTAEPARRIIEFAADAHEEMQAQRDALLKQDIARRGTRPDGWGFAMRRPSGRQNLPQIGGTSHGRASLGAAAAVTAVLRGIHSQPPDVPGRDQRR
jgi:hypothetical protein